MVGELGRLRERLAELERADAERRRTEEALRQSEERHRLIAELTSDYAYTGRIWPDGRITTVSATEGFERVTGYTLEEFEAAGGWPHVIHPDDLAVATDKMELLRAGVRHQHQVRIITKSGTTRWIRYSTLPLRESPGGPVVGLVGAVQDVTEAALAEQALRYSEELNRRILESMPGGMVQVGTDGSIQQANGEAQRILGIEYDRLTRMYVPDWDPVTTYEDGRHCPAEEYPVSQCLRTGQPQRSVVLGVRRPDGRNIWAMFTAIPLRGPDGKLTGAVVTFVDITDQKKVEEELRASRARLGSLSRQLLAAQETERRRLARELHDELGQVLTAISMNLQTIKGLCDSSIHPRFEESLAILDRAIQQVRDLSLELRPSVLDDLGLAAALRWYADRHAQRTGLTIHVSTDVPARLPTQIETACFRVVQEALTNVARHARARQAWVEVRGEEELYLVVRDDGAGFDVRAALQRAAQGVTFGLLGMQERVELLGGTLSFASRPGAGTRVEARVPLGAGEPGTAGCA
jgi:PAS domain S-box-containing protein